MEHKCHRYSRSDPQHLCCETRLPQRRRRAGNFPQCDSPLIFRGGACAQNQESKKERKGERNRAGGWGEEQEVVSERRERERTETERRQKMKIKWKEVLKRRKEKTKRELS